MSSFSVHQKHLYIFLRIKTTNVVYVVQTEDDRFVYEENSVVRIELQRHMKLYVFAQKPKCYLFHPEMDRKVEKWFSVLELNKNVQHNSFLDFLKFFSTTIRTHSFFYLRSFSSNKQPPCHHMISENFR